VTRGIKKRREAGTRYRSYRSVLQALLVVLVAAFPAHFLFSPAAPATALDVPPLTGYVNDYGSMMSPKARAALEKELKGFEASDSTQLFILTVPSLQGDALEDFSIKAAGAWGIGQKGKDNGVLLFVSKQDRKIRIEVGRGLEGRLTDLRSGRIIDLVIKPHFKRGDFDGGFIAGTNALIDATRGEFKAEGRRTSTRGKGHLPLLTFLIFGGIALLILGSISRILGGVAGGLGLPAVAYLAAGPPLLTLILVGIGGLLAGIFLPLLFSGRGGGGGGGWFLPGGFSGGGSSWGGGDSGGDFGGGGGGDFGGGGASGDW